MKRLFALFLLFPLSVFADLPDLTLSLEPPTERVDGSPLAQSEIAWYTITITEPDGVEIVQTTTDTSMTFTPSQMGIYKICAQTEDTDGLTSDKVCLSKPLIPPSPPGNLTIVIVHNIQAN